MGAGWCSPKGARGWCEPCIAAEPGQRWQRIHAVFPIGSPGGGCGKNGAVGTAFMAGGWPVSVPGLLPRDRGAD